MPARLLLSALRRCPHARLAAPAARTAAAARQRGFRTTARQLTKTLELAALPGDLVPPYPYGPARTFKVSNRGLYGGARRGTGNVNSGQWLVKVRRAWYPNVQRKVLYSEALRARVRTRLTTRVFKTVRREGGLDNYVLGSKQARIRELGPGGWRLRWLVMQSDAVRARFTADRAAAGLPPPDLLPSAPRKPGMLDVAMDCATPGKVNRRNRDAMDAYLRQIVGMEEFGIGPDEDVADFDAGTRDPSDARPDDVTAGQALQVRNMAERVRRRNANIQAGSYARFIRRRFKK